MLWILSNQVILYSFSFYSFRKKLEYACKVNNKKLCIVNEAYTSKTCCNCGVLNDVQGSEVYKCKDCGLIVDRDVNGALNIMIKNISVKS